MMEWFNFTIYRDNMVPWTSQMYTSEFAARKELEFHMRDKNGDFYFLKSRPVGGGWTTIESTEKIS